jgi:8-oxo-dGTP diphosphatase
MNVPMTFPYRFCPACGAPLDLPQDGEHEQLCRSCGNTQFNNPKPCAGAFVIRKGKVLLVRRGRQPYQGCWDIPGGFVAPDEHPAAGAVREVREETGLRIRITRLSGMYLDTYGAESTEHTLNIYYEAEVVDGTAEAASDAAEIGWFGPAELPERIAFPHSREALEAWAAGSDSGHPAA